MTALTENKEQALVPLCEFLEGEIIDQLRAQGHIATSKLVDSVKVEVRRTAYGYIIEGKAEGYARYVDRGRRAGARRVPIDAIMSWIKVRNISVSGMKERDLAFAIQTNIFKFGIPTNRDSGKTGFVTTTLERNTTTIKEMINTAMSDILSIELNNIIRNVKQRINAANN
jgi:hypothetical protein